MNNKFNNVISLLVGFSTGAIASWIYCKKKMEKEIDEEVKSVKETYSREFKHLQEQYSDTTSPDNNGARDECGLYKGSYSKKLGEYNTATKDIPEDAVIIEESGDFAKIIDEHEFNNADDEECETLIYHKSTGKLYDFKDQEIDGWKTLGDALKS